MSLVCTAAVFRLQPLAGFGDARHTQHAPSTVLQRLQFCAAFRLCRQRFVAKRHTRTLPQHDGFPAPVATCIGRMSTDALLLASSTNEVVLDDVRHFLQSSVCKAFVSIPVRDDQTRPMASAAASSICHAVACVLHLVSKQINDLVGSRDYCFGIRSRTWSLTMLCEKLCTTASSNAGGKASARLQERNGWPT